MGHFKKWAAALLCAGAMAFMPTVLAKDFPVQIPLPAAAGTYRAQDDFFLHVNAEWLQTTPIAPEEGLCSTIKTVLPDRVRQQLMAITRSAIEQRAEHPAASDEARIADMYACIIDQAGRNAAGVGDLAVPLRRIEAVQTLQEYADTMADISRQYSCSAMLGGYYVANDPLKNDKYVVYLAGPSNGLGREFMGNAANEPYMELYRGYIRDLLVLYGRTPAAAAKAAADIFALEKDIAMHSLTVGEAADPSQTMHRLGLDGVRKLYSRVDAAAMLKAAGIGPDSGIQTWYVREPGTIERLKALYKPELLPTLKEFANLSLLESHAPFLTQEYQNITTAYVRQMQGAQIEKSAERKAEELNEALLSNSYGRLYASRYFDEQRKAEVSAYVALIIDEYKKKITSLDWMSQATKAQALKKLDTMRINIGYPQAWPEYVDAYTVVRPEDGGCLINNVLALSRQIQAYERAKVGQPLRTDLWENLRPQTVNAFYTWRKNSINFPAGILQAPFYDKAALPETNLGGIGMVIAHEISHSFDSSGAQFDERGRLHNWWHPRDYAEFKKRQAGIVRFYARYALPNGVHMNGAQTLVENIADLGAVSCLTDIIGHDPEKLRRLYTNFAVCWRTKYTDALLQQALVNIHSLPYVRVDAVLSSTDGFYEAYSVQPGDGMYVAPEERARFW